MLSHKGSAVKVLPDHECPHCEALFDNLGNVPLHL